MKYEGVCALSDNALVVSLDALAKRDRELTADIVAHLAAMEERGLHLELGYSSLYVYATERLGFSEDAAYKRIRVARLVRRHPQVLADLESGELSVATVVMLAPAVLAGDEMLLEKAKGMSKAEVRELLSNDWPRGQLTKIELHVDDEFLKTLEEAKALHPGKLEEVFRKALDSLVAHDNGKRHDKVEREVMKRDEGRCTYVGTGGRRCNEQAFIEFDHVHPQALGGEHSVKNVRLLCHAHNQFAAELIFGKQHMAEARALQRRRLDVASALRNLDFDRQTVASVVANLNAAPDVPLEQVLRQALQLATAAR